MFALRHIVNNVTRVIPGVRNMSAAKPLIGVDVDNQGIAIVTMQRPPVNSLNLDLLLELIKTLDFIAENKCKGMILTSSFPNVFSAGLDITELYKPDVKRVAAVWTAFQEVWIKLFGSNFVTAAAVTGHAPAGACLLAISCEYRVMVNGKYTIGLNEANLGPVVPRWLTDTMGNTISKRETEFAVTSGKLFSADDALKVGLIDELAPNKIEAIEKCRKFIKKFDRIPYLARAITKRKIREAPLKWMQENRQQDTEECIKNITHPKIQQALETYIEDMKRRKEKKNYK